MTLGIVAYLVFVKHSTIVPLYWGQAAVFWLEMAICLVIWFASDWPRYASDARLRQEANKASPVPLRSPITPFSPPSAQLEAMALTGLSPNEDDEQAGVKV